jgi:ATP adenylyltransferase
MQYIQEAAEGLHGCLFCDKAASGDPARDMVLERGTHAFALMNLFPYTPGHLMIAPLAHIGSPEEMEDSVALELHALTRRWLRALRAVMSPHGFNLGWNIGRAAGAGVVDHAHLHVVPRWNGDNNFMPVVGGIRVVNEALRDTYLKLREAAGVI